MEHVIKVECRTCLKTHYKIQKMFSNKPIGFFDSGVGGTSIWKEAISLLAKEKTIYLADSANAPYGKRNREEIVSLSVKNTEKLLEMGCKMIVVACNTATTNAIEFLRDNYTVPFVGIEPAIKPAALASKSKAIGILATQGTLSSALFAKTAGLYASDTKVIEVEGNGLVELIEAGKKDSPEMLQLLKIYLEPMLRAHIDHLVLGCSHYPYLTPILRSLLPHQVTIIDSGRAVARQTQKLLEKYNLENPKTLTEENSADRIKHRLYANSNLQVLMALTSDVPIRIKVEFLDF